MVTYTSNTLDKLCARAYEKRTAEHFTWTQVVDRIIWKYLFIMTAFHVGFIAALASYVLGFHSVPVKTMTIVWIFVVGYTSSFGTTAGAHRLWSHRSYKAKLPVRISFMILYCVMGLNPLYYWVRDHRVHHKYVETDADPHNAERGFVFSHWGWLFMNRHPESLRRGKEVDMSDIIADPVVMFQKKHANKLKLLACFVIPTVIPIIFWNETVLHAVLTQCFIRYVLFLNFMFCVNSVAHTWGDRPYNRWINPTDSRICSFLTFGEGSHNYHHTFPWDYKTSEFPFMNFNSTTFVIHTMAKLGWVSDLRAPSPEFVEKVIRRIGYKSEITEAAH